ncbi:MFS general substrate transporter [Suillus fuscotomentosus]|uniref:MFS general substrate transporter n=1 Tax=Suillus fuscotomentosus TaxID=1912939 RepID=A0AAD4HNX0_9AGAM|nr:MFS general substrate transporter [Suillus fuscotomentosus]KAG1903206.1 MFS general substrate transporter [Suillus fuscotomentosus]
MSLSPVTIDPVFTSDKANLAPGATSICRVSPEPSCKLGLTESVTVDAIELSPVTPVNKQNYDSENPSVLSARYETQRTREKIQFVTLCWFNYLGGWNDGSNGPLLPRIQKVYGVGYAVVSLIFICACVGYITGAVSNVILTEKLGFGKVDGSLCQVLAYCIESTGPPFPVFVFAYFINGIGLANANAVGYVACLKENAEAKIGVFAAVYGAGALSSPLVATQFSHLPHWNLHFLTSLGIAIINTIALIIVFRLKPQAECLSEIGIVDSDNSTSEHSHLRQIFANKDVHLLAAFTLLYVGVEVTLGGWIVTYIIDVRGGGPSSGYVSSGFFGGMQQRALVDFDLSSYSLGLMVGRVALLWLNKKIGERLVLFIYTVLIIIFEFIVWFVPSLIGDAIVVCVIGMLLGPMYPIIVTHARRILPRRILTGSIGWISGVGQAGSAMVPFMVGAIAQTAGMKVLQPVLIGILGIMTGLWALVCYGSSSCRPD